MNHNFFTVFLKIFQSKIFGEKLQMSSLSMKEFLQLVMGADTASSQQLVAVLKMQVKSRRIQMVAIIFAGRGHLLVRKAEKNRSARF